MTPERLAKDGDVQPRFRSIIWRELPPFVRRACVGWSRSLLHAELFLGELYLSWTKSPTWNFVGIVGTIGIVLTILLFLIPLEFQGEAAPRDRLSAQRDEAMRRPWELDATLSIASRSQAYPVEIELGTRRGRRTPVLTESTPRVPAPKPRITEPAPDFEWDNHEPAPPQVVRTDPPRLEVELEFIPPTRRYREPVVADVSWTARAKPPDDSALRRFDSHRDLNDPWRLFDAHRVADHRHPTTDPDSVALLHDAGVTGAHWEPPAFPETAPATVEVDLELSWDRTTWSVPHRRGRAPQLHLRNLGPTAIPRMDVLRGQLPLADLTIPQPWMSQVLPALSPGQEHVDARLTNIGRSRSGTQFLSVLVTTFVGNQTTATEAVVAKPTPPRAREKAPARQADQPHLTLTTEPATRLREHKMLQVPMRVVNDGNVTLEGITILAEIPSSLEHRYGRTVHFRIGALRPNQERRTLLLLTPLEAGSSTVKLYVANETHTAADEGVVQLNVSEQDLTEQTAESRSVWQTSAADSSPHSSLRRRTAGTRNSGN